MIASGREAAIEDLIRELEIADPTETGLGTWDRPDGEMRVSMFHETGHVYAVPDDVTEERDAELLFRLPVEKIGIDAAIKAVEGYLGATRQPKLRECDMLSCHNPVPEDSGKSVAPGTYLAVCDECAPIVATVR